MNNQIVEYDLYLDESGDFMEVSRVEKERQRSKTRKLGTQSQLVGLLVPRASDIEYASKAITDAAKAKARLPKTYIHATDIMKKQSRYQYQEAAQAIIRGVESHSEWQPVRLVNLEEVPYYDRSSIYANLVAELVLRTLEAKSKALPETKIGIRLIDPSYMIDEPGDPVLHKLKAEEYRKRISEYLGFAAVRYGLARQQRRWRFDGIIGKPYRETDAMQICDVLSNASYHDFENLQRQSMKSALRQLFGDYDFTLTIRELFERVDELSKEHSYGVALMVLAEAIIHAPHDTKQDQDFAVKLEERLNHIVERLGRMDFRGRDPQLALLVGWLDQLVGQQRLLDKGYEIAHWLLEHVETPLRTHLATHHDEPTLDWFAYSLRRWALTACNHKGVLLKAQAEVEEMRSLQPSVASQWERIPLVMDGVIAQAVHYTDCFEFDKASKRMRFVADSLKMQSNRFHELMPQDFPEKLRFDLRARALGTLVQSEIFAGATDPARLQSARDASEEAIAEFNSFSDRARQYQYRCHLETVGRDYPAARKYLVWSLEGTDEEPTVYSHNRIADLISEKGVDPEWKGEFTLLHWLRIGAYTCLDAHEASDRALTVGSIAETDQATVNSQHSEIESDKDDFLAALDLSGQLDLGACQGRLSEYPAHSILRFVAVINAARGNRNESLLALQHLRALDPIGKEQFVLAMVLVAAQTEVAAIIWNQDEATDRAPLNDGDSSMLGLTRLIHQIQEKTNPELISFTAILKRWPEALGDLVQGSASSAKLRRGLLGLARSNAY